jgi:hypothetical protein
MQISQISDMFALTLDQGEATFLSPENLNLRRNASKIHTVRMVSQT